MRRRKVILDTNLWIGFLISKRLNSIDYILIDGRVRLIFSKELIEEFLAVVKRPKFRKYFSDEKIFDLLRLFDMYGVLIEVTTEIMECRDLKDNFLLNLAVDSKAHFLITGDSDLLMIKKIGKTKIVTWTEFIEELK